MPKGQKRLFSERKPVVTVVTPVFNEEEGLDHYFATVERVLFTQTEVEWKILLVDDGSADQSWSIVQAQCAKDRRFEGLRLSRNFGSHSALSAGLNHAEGDAVTILAADLQDPAEVVLQFVEQWLAGYDIVWGKRISRKESWLRSQASTQFANLARRHAMPKGSRFTTGSFLLMDRKVLACYRAFPEKRRITFALVAWTGFDQQVVAYHRKAREFGTSGWTLSRMLQAFYDTFIGFSNLPLRLMSFLGVATALFSVVIAIYVIANWLFTDVVPGWTAIMLGISFFFSIVFFILGMMTEYLHRIHQEVLGRPVYFISEQTDDYPPQNAADPAKVELQKNRKTQGRG
uniref:Putative GT2: related to bactoprenol glucosyltransferases n=1 Tax=Magnetococcus massalia (strain MO-1) TaxID=451514 RepID=A0A1S7LFC3_MAGMO|nr:putative GT2 : related to bactoprenol glucosyltransferases [Candidatus Magnetococcus massalia]